MPLHVHYLTTLTEHSKGAVHKSCLGDEILAFVYPVPVPRTHSTFFKPPLRIVAIDMTKRKAIFDEVVQPSKFVLLPSTRLVLEMDPGIDYFDILPEIIATIDNRTQQHTGEAASNVSAQQLVFGLFADALAEIRRVKSMCLVDGEVAPELLRSKLLPWERGKIIGAAGFVIDYQPTVTWQIPMGAVKLARQILTIEVDYHDELIAASIAGIPWQNRFDTKCVRCLKGGSWRFALAIPDGMPVEISWRLERPENAVPLCRICAGTLKFSQKERLRHDLVSSLWGPRFDALEKWYLAIQQTDGYRLDLDWSLEEYPLWPKSFGGDSWGAGSGYAQCCEPCGLKNIERTPDQQRMLAEVFRIDIEAFNDSD